MFKKRKYLLVLVILLVVFTSIIIVNAQEVLLADNFRFPLEGNWSPLWQDFGKWNSTWNGYHLGEDVGREDADKKNYAVYPMADGIVKFANIVLGYTVIIEHRLSDDDLDGNYVCSVYYHMKKPGEGGIKLTVGESVSIDSPIGYISGKWEDHKSSPHLHFGIRKGCYKTGKDPRTGFWYYPGYTVIKKDGEVQKNPDDPIHKQILADWFNPSTDPKNGTGFIERHVAKIEQTTEISKTTPPSNFIKLNNDFAVSVVKLEKNEYNRITAIIAIKKLSPSDFKYHDNKSATITLDLIDDQGEIFSTTNYLCYFIEQNLYKLPKGFILTRELSTSAPALALNHIKTIKLLGQKVNLIELALEPLENLECIIHATEDVQLDKWLDFKINGIIDNKLKGFRGYYIKGTIRNSSYDNKEITIGLTCQNKNGKLFYADGRRCEISGKSYKVFAISLDTSKIEEVGACIINVRKYDNELKDYKQFLFIVPMHKMPFFYPPTIHYIGSAPKYWKVFYDDPPRLETFKSSTHYDFAWKTNVGMDHVSRWGDDYKFIVSFDKGEGILRRGIHSKTGKFIEWDAHDAVYRTEWTIVFPGEATNANFHIEEK